MTLSKIRQTAYTHTFQNTPNLSSRIPFTKAYKGQVATKRASPASNRRRHKGHAQSRPINTQTGAASLGLSLGHYVFCACESLSRPPSANTRLWCFAQNYFRILFHSELETPSQKGVRDCGGQTNDHHHNYTPPHHRGTVRSEGGCIQIQIKSFALRWTLGRSSMCMS